MKRVMLIVLPLSACGVAMAAAAAIAAAAPAPSRSQGAARESRQTYSDRYSILSQRNIFLKDRSRAAGESDSRNATTSPAATRPAQRSPEETLLLRGIVVEEGQVRAYFEDIVNSSMVRVGQGDILARGRVISIGLDAIEYQPAAAAAPGSSDPSAAAAAAAAVAKPIIVAIGNDLTGRAPAAAATATTATTGPVMPTGLEGLDPNDPNLTVEQRLKLRRLQELKR